MEWNDFYQSMSWRELLQVYDDGIAHVERFTAAHPEKNIAADILRAIERLTVLHAHVKKAAATPALLDQPAPVEATKIILSAVGQVRRDVPLVPQVGQA